VSDGARTGAALACAQTSVLVADPFAMFRFGVRAVLERTGGFAVFEARTLPDALDAVGSNDVAIALIDHALPPVGGIEASARLAKTAGLRAVLWSTAPRPEDVVDALRAGAAGYLDKRMDVDGLVGSLRAISAGETVVPRDLVASSVPAGDRVAAATGEAFSLSRREYEVLERLVRGARNREIAAELGISEFTVKRHVQNILRKLGVPSRWAAATLYRAHSSRRFGRTLARERA
jgi:DNA-binding NarL/FixJ family response regulator